MKPGFDTNRQLDRIAAAVLFLFALFCLLLPIAISQFLRTRTVQAEIQDLQVRAEELQETIDQLQAQAADREVSENLEVIDQTLEEMTEQIDDLGDDLGLSRATEEPLATPALDMGDEANPSQLELFSLLGWTVGLLSILTALVWASLLIGGVRQRKRPPHMTKDKG